MKTHRCHATIVFADLTSSTRIGESLDPEQVAEVLGALRQVAEDVIARHGGVVNQFYGDGVLAAFGFPEPQEDDVLRAIDATLDLHQAVKSVLPMPGIELPDFSLQLHSGIHAGLVFVQEGDRIQGRYKLTGDALNTAARLSDAAQPNEVLVSASTILGVLPFFDTETTAPLQLKGKRLPLEAFKVLQRSSVRTRYAASISRGLSRYVGRNDEMRLLEQDFAAACQQGARYFEICGDPGLGKTRLSEEFIASLEASAVTVCKAYCSSDDSGKPLYPFAQILRSLFSLGNDMTAADAVACFEQQLQDRYAALATYSSYLLRVLGLAESSAPKEDGTELSHRTIEAIVALIQIQTRQHPVVLYLDDWHLADDLSNKTLVTLLEKSAALPLFVLTATRTALDVLHFFSGRTLKLTPLNQPDCAKLAARFFQHALDRTFIETIFRRSGGNPLFIEELCQSSQWHLASQDPESNSHDIPVTLNGLIASRLNRLPDNIRSLVNIAAVLGTLFETWLFEAMLQLPLTEHLRHTLMDYDVIYPGGSASWMRFKHGITREVAYEQISLKERKSLHKQVCVLLERHTEQYGGEDYFELLAYHYAGAEEKLPAGKYAELAGDMALATMALDRAGNQYSRALKMLDPTFCAGSTYARWKAMLLKFGWVSVFDPQPDQLRIFERGLQLARQNQDLEGLAKTEHWLGYLHYALGNSTEAINHCQHAITAAESLQATPLLVETIALLGQAKGSGTEYREALQLLDQALDAKSKHKQSRRPSLGSAYSLACKGAVLGDQGHFPEAYDCFENALDTLKGADHQLKGSVLGLYSCVKLWQGEWDAARVLAENAQTVGQKISSAYMFTMYIGLAEYARWMLTQDDSCLPRILSATHSLEVRGKMLFVSLNYGWAAEILQEKQKWQACRKFAARAVARARHHDRLGEAMAYRALASLSHSVNSPHYARYLDLAHQSARARESRHEEAKNQLHWARLLFAQQQNDKAHRYLEQALNSFRAMQMPWFEQQALRLVQDKVASA